MATVSRTAARRRRHAKVRKKVVGTAEKPRLAVFRSLHHMHAQLIDDSAGITIASASTVEPELRKALEKTGNSAAAGRVGELIAERAKEAGVEQVVFDRGGNLYHGRVKVLAEAARAAGLKF